MTRVAIAAAGIPVKMYACEANTALGLGQGQDQRCWHIIYTAVIHVYFQN